MVIVTEVLHQRIESVDELVEQLVEATRGGVIRAGIEYSSNSEVAERVELIRSKDVGRYFWAVFDRKCEEISGESYLRGIFGAKQIIRRGKTYGVLTYTPAKK